MSVAPSAAIKHKFMYVCALPSLDAQTGAPRGGHKFGFCGASAAFLSSSHIPGAIDVARSIDAQLAFAYVLVTAFVVPQTSFR